MISTQNLQELPAPESLREMCRAMSVIEAIVQIANGWNDAPEFDYNPAWGDGEETFIYNNHSGDALMILFKGDRCVVVGCAHEAEYLPMEDLAQGLPDTFHEFVFGEPSSSLGITFLFWHTGQEGWETSDTARNHKFKNPKYGDGSQDIMEFFNKWPKSYVKWSADYYERDRAIPAATINKLRNGAPLAQKMAKSVCASIEDWDRLYLRLDEIGYPCGYKVTKISPADAVQDATSFLKLCKSGTPEDILEAIRLGADVNAKNKKNQTPLMYAMENPNNPEIAVMLIDAGANVNASETADYLGQRGETVLVKAIRRNAATVQALIEHGASVNGCSILNALSRYNPSIYKEKLEIMRILIEAGADVNERGEVGGVALMESAELGYIDEVVMLLNAGADVNAIDNNSKSALSAAIAHRQSANLIVYLIEKGADIRGAMHLALSSGVSFDTKICMAEHGADVNETTLFGVTLLMQTALYCSNPDIALMLIDKGAEVNAATSGTIGKALRRAINKCVERAEDDPLLMELLTEADAKSNGEIEFLARRLKQRRFLTLPKAKMHYDDAVTGVLSQLYHSELMFDIAMKKEKTIIKRALPLMLNNCNKRANRSGVTAVMLAAGYNENPAMILALTTRGADLNTTAEGGYTALMNSVFNNNSPEIIPALIKNGADVNAVTEDGYTALMTIFDMRLEQSPNVKTMEKAVTALLDNGADASIRNKDGITAQYLADKFADFKTTEAYKRMASL